MTVQNLQKRSNSGHSAISTSKLKKPKSVDAKVDKHIRWKDPPVDKIHRYRPLSPAPHVHWKDPLVEGTFRYPTGPLPRGHKPPKLPKPPTTPPKGISGMKKLTAGILKDHVKVVVPSIPKEISPRPIRSEPTIADAIYNEKIDTFAMAKYPPLIPLPPVSNKKGILKNGKRDLNVEFDGDTLIDSSGIPETQLPVESLDDQSTLSTEVASSDVDGNLSSDVESEFGGLRTDWPDDPSSVDSGSLNSYNESVLVTNLKLLLPRSTPGSDSPSSPPSFASSVATRDQFQRSVAPAIPGLGLMMIPITIICWFKQLFETFDRWPGPYREHRNGGSLGRRNHPRDWNIKIE